MTNPALDALNELLEDAVIGGKQRPLADLNNLAQTVRTALSNAPEVVTPLELLNELRPKRTSAFGGILWMAERFPNGLKITAAPNGGA